MNKRKVLCAALLAVCLWPGVSEASEVSGIHWALAGSAGEEDGAARNITVIIAPPTGEAPAEAEETAPGLPAGSSLEAGAVGSVPAMEDITAPSPIPVAEVAPVLPAEEMPVTEAAAEEMVSPEERTASIPEGAAEAPAENAARPADPSGESAEPAVMPAEPSEAAQAAEDSEAARAADEKEESAAVEIPMPEDFATYEGEDEYAWGMIPMEISETAALGDEPVWSDERKRDEMLERMTAGGEIAPRRSSKKDKKAGGASVSPENPVVLWADSMAYRGSTGDVDLRGNVVVAHMRDRYRTEHLFGNTNTKRYIIPGELRLYTPENRMTAESATYDANTSIGTFENLKGWNRGKYYYQGDSGVYDRNENKITVQKGYFTTKHAVARVPDYRIEAERIDIYPNDHYKAHNATLYFKNAKILSMSSYSGSLRDGSNLMTLIPTPTYDSDNGWGLKNRLTLPIGGADSDVAFDARLAWYTKEGFRPDVGFRWETGIGTFRFRYSEEESTVNDYNVWLTRKPALSFNSRRFYIPGTEFYVGARGEIAEWEETRNGREISGSHMMWDTYLSHNPIPLGTHMRFFWRLGYMKDYYGYNDSIRSNRYYTLGLRARYGILSPWVIYTDRNLQGRSPYRYDTYSMDKPVNMGIKVQLTPKDAISISYSIDTVDGELEHRYFTYYRDMHSFFSWLRYDNIEKEYKFMIMPKDFRF